MAQDATDTTSHTGRRDAVKPTVDQIETVSHAAVRLGISRSYITQLMRDPDSGVKAYQIAGGVIVLETQALDAWNAARLARKEVKDEAARAD
jgi:hypothetical protein